MTNTFVAILGLAEDYCELLRDRSDSVAIMGLRQGLTNKLQVTARFLRRREQQVRWFRQLQILSPTATHPNKKQDDLNVHPLDFFRFTSRHSPEKKMIHDKSQSTCKRRDQPGTKSRAHGNISILLWLWPAQAKSVCTSFTLANTGNKLATS